jgi:hypothetical protein
MVRCNFCNQECKNEHGLSIHIGRMHKNDYEKDLFLDAKNSNNITLDIEEDDDSYEDDDIEK